MVQALVMFGLAMLLMRRCKPHDLRPCGSLTMVCIMEFMRIKLMGPGAFENTLFYETVESSECRQASRMNRLSNRKLSVYHVLALRHYAGIPLMIRLGHLGVRSSIVYSAAADRRMSVPLTRLVGPTNCLLSRGHASKVPCGVLVA